MRYVVISDLHLGVGDRAERFGASEDAFMRWLDARERWADRIIVAGDLYETWQGARFGDTRARLDAIRAAWPRLVTRLHSTGYAHVYGNHDPCLADEGVPRARVFESDGARVWVAHGHRWDTPLRRCAPIAYTFSWARGWIDRRDTPWAQRVRARREAVEQRFLWNAPIAARVDTPDDATCRVQRGALALLAARPDLDVAVCGHTHVPARCASPDGVYLNSGALSGGVWSWLELDTAARAWVCRVGHDGRVLHEDTRA